MGIINKYFTIKNRKKIVSIKCSVYTEKFPKKLKRTEKKIFMYHCTKSKEEFLYIS